MWTTLMFSSTKLSYGEFERCLDVRLLTIMSLA